RYDCHHVACARDDCEQGPVPDIVDPFLWHSFCGTFFLWRLSTPVVQASTAYPTRTHCMQCSMPKSLRSFRGTLDNKPVFLSGTLTRKRIGISKYLPHAVGRPSSCFT